MTSPERTPGAYSRAHAAEIHGRWVAYFSEARAALGAGASLDQLVARAASRWARAEPPELSFVPDAMRATVRESEHDTTDDTFLDRIVGGQVTALRRREDGAVVFLKPERAAAMTTDERARYEPYDPLLARALRRRALEVDIERLAEAEEGEGE
ncbi:MAG: hypothetical protein WEB13_02995 [Dehalococcoidia bacterium]